MLLRVVPEEHVRAADQADPRSLASLRGVFFDIDETFSTRGKITAEAYDALWRLHGAGLRVVPVTGRSAGWCDHIARFWPVDAVVGENGGFYFHHDGARLQRRFLCSDDERRAFRDRLDAIRVEILAEVPGCAVASGQLYREYDLAIDFCEDVEPLGRDDVLRIRCIFLRHGARAKISSVHVNGWFGEFDKLSTSRLCARELFEVDLERDPEAFAFLGDSPNDAPMFAAFPLSFGMANIERFRGMMDHEPTFVARAESGAGFVEVAELILKARAERRPPS
ncbi:HAD-IIB family hydrolase [Candidatus Sumerlaeota bacterium]|nr:HAD-IIB family hydrolase [Candidatus Sumerlaeota bacterium]